MKQIPDEKDLHVQHYEQIREKLANEPFAQFLGMRLVDMGPGTATVEMEVDGRLLNAHGTTHGAAIFALADFAFAVASNSYGKSAVALSMNIGFLAASGLGTRLRATAIEEKKGNRTAWYRITVESDTEVVALLDALAYRKSDYIIPIEE